MNAIAPLLQEKINQSDALLKAICVAMSNEYNRLNLNKTKPITIDCQQASYHLERDPASGSDSLVGVWHDQKDQKIGMMVIHADNSFFAEYDVLLPLLHPEKLGNFVEAVTAWGRGEMIKSEARLLNMPTE